MSDLSRADTLTKAIVAAQEEAATIPLREDDNDDDTIRGRAGAKIDATIFEGFTDFKLDLSCLSPPASPTASTSELPPLTPSPPSTPILSRTKSYASQLTIATKKSTKKASAPQLSSTVPAGSRGSWPIIRYAGRGTPIDRNRRLEWGGFPGEDVAEDGVLFAAARSTSLDSAIRPSQRSLSPDWNHRSPLSSANSHSTHSDSHRTASTYEQAPALAPIQFEGLGADKSEDWDSIMKTVLSSTKESPEPAEVMLIGQSKSEMKGMTKSINDTDFSNMPQTMSPEQMQQLNNGLEIDLGLNAALDLGLGQKGGMNWFDLGLLPTSASGRESPSVYSSQAHSPEHSPAPSLHASEHRSTTSTKAEADFSQNVKSEPHRWWKKIMVRLRKVQTMITVHKNRL